MNNKDNFVYYYNSSTNKIFTCKSELPQKKANVYLILNREKLYFDTFQLNQKQKLKNIDILNIQKNFIPFKDRYLNLIYSIEKKNEKNVFFWISPSTIQIDSYFYDEVPESLLFKGDPSKRNKYNIFVFKRQTGFEVIYFNQNIFFSIFTKSLSNISNNINSIVRKYSLRDKTKILTDIDLGDLAKIYSITLISSDSEYYFLPDFFDIKKKFSDISKDKQIRSIKDIVKHWNKRLSIIISLLSIFILINISFLIILNIDKNTYEKKYNKISKVIKKSEIIEFKINRENKRISLYPDHMLFFKKITESIIDDSFLTNYSLSDGKIIIEGYSNDSRLILSKLQKSNLFDNVKFNSTITKNIHSKKEKFNIDIKLKKNE